MRCGAFVESGRAAANVLRAQAFATGNNIAWPDSAPAMGSAGGQRLPAHELAHVEQVHGGAVAEQEARAAASSIAIGGPIRTSPTQSGLVYSAEEWLTGSHDLSTRSYSDWVADIEEIKRWLRSQSESTPGVLRLEQVVEERRAEVDRRDNKAKLRSTFRRPANDWFCDLGALLPYQVRDSAGVDPTRIVCAVSRPLASAASTVPISGPS